MSGNLINLNEASAEELNTVPGLQGHGYEIVRYRSERGAFTELRQLEEVPGLAGKSSESLSSLTLMSSSGGKNETGLR